MYVEQNDLIQTEMIHLRDKSFGTDALSVFNGYSCNVRGLNTILLKV